MLQIPEGGIIIMIGVTTMVTEKGTGISTQNQELLAAIIVVTKLTNQAQDWIGWQQVRAELTGQGAHTDMTHFPPTIPRMVHCM